MSTPVYKPIREGVYQHKGSVISVNSQPNQLSVSQKKAHMSIWVGEIPDNWKLCEAVVDEAALAVPLDDIERLLRAGESVLGLTRDGNLLLRRVQAWIDTIPRESKATDAPPQADL